MPTTYLQATERNGVDGAQDIYNLALIDGALPIVVVGSAGVLAPLIVVIPETTLDISVLTPLFPLTSSSYLGTTYRTHLLWVVNLGSVNVTMTLDTSSDGVHTEPDKETQLVIAPGFGGPIVSGDFPPHPYYGLAAQSADLSVQSVKFGWLAVPR